jgi:hypothetical protein
MASKSAHSMKIGNVNIGWYAPKEAYKNIAAQVGAKVNSTDKELVFGANSPKPVVVRFNLEGGRSATRFVHPDKIASVCFQNSCKGKILNGKKVLSANTIGR